MYQSKNCGHGFDLYIKGVRYSSPLLAPLTKAGELRNAIEELTGECYFPFTPAYCPICGQKVEEAEND